VIISPGGIGFVKMMGCRKTNVCNGKNGGLLTSQALRENPCVPPFVNDMEMISPELGAMVVYEKTFAESTKGNKNESVVHSLLSRQSRLQQNKLKGAICVRIQRVRQEMDPVCDRYQERKNPGQSGTNRGKSIEETRRRHNGNRSRR
jgi:hypothetical protein